MPAAQHLQQWHEAPSMHVQMLRKHHGVDVLELTTGQAAAWQHTLLPMMCRACCRSSAVVSAVNSSVTLPTLGSRSRAAASCSAGGSIIAAASPLQAVHGAGTKGMRSWANRGDRAWAHWLQVLRAARTSVGLSCALRDYRQKAGQPATWLPLHHVFCIGRKAGSCGQYCFNRVRAHKPTLHAGGGAAHPQELRWKVCHHDQHVSAASGTLLWDRGQQAGPSSYPCKHFAPDAVQRGTEAQKRCEGV